MEYVMYDSETIVLAVKSGENAPPVRSFFKIISFWSFWRTPVRSLRSVRYHRSLCAKQI